MLASGDLHMHVYYEGEIKIIIHIHAQYSKSLFVCCVVNVYNIPEGQVSLLLSFSQMRAKVPRFRCAQAPLAGEG